LSVVTTHLIPDDIWPRFEVHEQRNAAAILKEACTEEWDDVLAVLRGFELRRSDVLQRGGRKSSIANCLDAPLIANGWTEHKFRTSIVVDDETFESPTHKVDCFRGRVALEVEWNNKDPFFDRDLNNFRLLFELQAIDLGVIITRCDELQEIFDDLGRGSSFGNSTTHMSKLLPRLRGGSGGGCPILVFGIRRSCYTED
jgi:hypothetical protein